MLGLTAGQGVDVAIEAIGVPATFEISQAIPAPGVRRVNVGVHGVPGTLHVVTLRFGLGDLTPACDAFEHAATYGALKVVLTNELRG